LSYETEKYEPSNTLALQEEVNSENCQVLPSDGKLFVVIRFHKALDHELYSVKP